MLQSRLVIVLLSLSGWTSRQNPQHLVTTRAAPDHTNGAVRYDPIYPPSRHQSDVEDMLRLDPHLLEDIGVCRCDLVHRTLAWHWGYACDEATRATTARRIEIARPNVARPL
jgi:hypothetical protein